MSDLLHKLVSGVLSAGLIALAGWLGMERRKRKAAKAAAQAAAAPIRPAGEPSQAPSRHAR